MEKIANIKITVPQEQRSSNSIATNTNRNEKTLCCVSGKLLNYYLDESGKFQLSQYTDEVATNEQIKGLLELVFAAYGFTEAEKIPMIMTVSRAKMTVNQLTDSINNILATQKFKPKPAEIVNWNKKNETIRVFTLNQAGKMAFGAVHWYYDMRVYENCRKGTILWNKAMDLYFTRIQQNNKVVVVNDQSYYVFTEQGNKNSEFLLNFLPMEDFQIENYAIAHHKEKKS